MSQSSRRLATAVVVAIMIFVTAIILPKIFVSRPVARVATTQVLELGLSLSAIAVLGKGRFADYGFRRPRFDRPSSEALLRWIPVGLGAVGLGAAATIVTLILGVGGNPIAKQLTLPQIALFVWILSSTIEEIFTRGFLQSHLAPATPGSFRFLCFRIETAAFIGAVFFSLMHLSLLLSGVGLTTIVILLLFTFSVGLLAGHQRARTDSLIPAVGVHMLANIGGAIGGLAYMIVLLLTGGRPPGM